MPSPPTVRKSRTSEIWAASISTTWPRYTRHITFIAALLVLAALIEIVLGGLIAAELFQYADSGVRCWNEGIPGVNADSAGSDVHKHSQGVMRMLPVKVVDLGVVGRMDEVGAGGRGRTGIEGRGVWFLEEVGSRVLILLFTIVFPLISLAFTGLCLEGHLRSPPSAPQAPTSTPRNTRFWVPSWFRNGNGGRRPSISNREAFNTSLWLTVIWLCYGLFDNVLYVDSWALDKRNVVECKVPGDVGRAMWEERSARLRTLMARTWVGVVGGCM
ncbi:hypothetical protein CC80DRAFT_262942 [Byssothecium circinans]|uniref:Uncharacterized protein n=1 Tax=Byssothecium circinans TaxID=147558 RepID=A0A6A5UA45_9PLEO|nr:hypothetical protein CC80DRAFT_262942 [Byssothecium circinans]